MGLLQGGCHRLAPVMPLLPKGDTQLLRAFIGCMADMATNRHLIDHFLGTVSKSSTICIHQGPHKPYNMSNSSKCSLTTSWVLHDDHRSLATYHLPPRLPDRHGNSAAKQASSIALQWNQTGKDDIVCQLCDNEEVNMWHWTLHLQLLTTLGKSKMKLNWKRDILFK